MTLLVGTSGWAYPEWQPAFYPAGLPRARFLEHYAGVMGMCEINATFYRVQSEKAVAAWAAAGGGALRVVCKVHRGITHSRTDDAGELVDRFVASLEPLGEAAAGVLAQFPPWRTRDDAWALALMRRLAPAGPVVMEFRHPSWDDDAVRDLVADAGGTVCLAHVEGPPPAALPPGPMAYVRLRADAYPAPERDRWRQLLETEAQTRPVCAVARHKDLPPDDPFAGLGLARWLAGDV